MIPSSDVVGSLDNMCPCSCRSARNDGLSRLVLGVNLELVLVARVIKEHLWLGYIVSVESPPPPQKNIYVVTFGASPSSMTLQVYTVC